jgi:CDP-diacylglycerol--serine O-phosphatidyltransferase
MKRHIPNTITSANLLCGCLSIQAAILGDLPKAAFFVLLAAFLDFFDGLAARLLKVSSPIGAQLDSLADVVSFGVAPSFMAFHLISENIEEKGLAYIAFLLAIFSALRLAKFNVDDRQTDQFIGLPTPANALLWVSLVLSIWQADHVAYGSALALMLKDLANDPFIVIPMTLVFAYLLVAELPLMSLKFKHFRLSGNQYRYLLLLISAVLIALFLFAAVPIILILYLILSIIQERSKKQTDEIQS